MSYKILYLPEALNDLKGFTKSDQKRIIDKIEHIATNPLPRNQGGLGEPLSNYSQKLAGCLKGKVNAYLFVYVLEIKDNEMMIIVGGFRRDDEV